MKFKDIRSKQLTTNDIDFINSLETKLVRFVERGMVKVDLWTSIRCELAPAILNNSNNTSFIKRNKSILSKSTGSYYEQDLDIISGILQYGEPNRISYLLQFSNSELDTEYEEKVSDYFVVTIYGEVAHVALEEIYPTEEEAYSYYISSVLNPYKKDMESIIGEEYKMIENSKKLLEEIEQHEINN